MAVLLQLVGSKFVGALAGFADNRWAFEGVFTGINVVYYMLYANEPHHYLSTMYSADKYGVVLNYVVMSIFTTHYRLLRQISNLQHRRDAGTMTKFHGQEVSSVEALSLILHGHSISSLMIMAKALALSAVFMLNTSVNPYHSITHVLCVGAYLGVHLLSSVTMSAVTGQPATNLLLNTIFPLFYGGAYLYFSKVNKQHPFLSLVFESLCLGSTLCTF